MSSKKHRKKHDSKTDTGGSTYARRSIPEAIGRIERMLSLGGYTFKKNYHIGIDVYREPFYVHFYIQNLVDFPNGLAVQILGSSPTETSLNYLMHTIKDMLPGPTIIIIPTSGLRSGQIDFLKRSVDGKKILHIFTGEEFEQWWRNAFLERCR